MKRMKKHKIKREMPDNSSAFNKLTEEHDLAYYIHDRVELVHQVFSVLKHKDLRTMAPECVRRLSIDDMQELCTEELLGISSKRLLAILDGAEPPSDTESSSQSSEHLEAISLDSISSDEAILSQENKKKHKHRRRNSKSSKKHKHKKNSESPQENKDQSKASRAGLTVLELLELQARARAIRAQLQQEQAKRSIEQVEPTTIESSQNSQSSDSEIEIKEEPAEVVVLSSSEDEKPSIKELDKETASSNNKEPEEKNSSSTVNNKTAPSKDAIDTNKTAEMGSNVKNKKNKKKDKSKKKDNKKEKKISDNREKPKSPASVQVSVAQNENRKGSDIVVEIDNFENKSPTEESKKVTKRVNDLIITVPQQSSRKIKLNRNKRPISVSDALEKVSPVVEERPSSVVIIPEKRDKTVKKVSSLVIRPSSENKSKTNALKISNETTEDKVIEIPKQTAAKTKSRDKSKKKIKKKEMRKSIEEDHDEITLQLSDSEKMDLLEDFDRKNYDNVSSSSSDSECSSADSSDDGGQSIQDTSKEFLQDSVNMAKLGDETITKNGDDNSANDTLTSCKSEDHIEDKMYESSENINETPQVCDNDDAHNPTIETKCTGTKSPVEKIGFISISNKHDELIEISNKDDIPVQSESEEGTHNNSDTDKCKEIEANSAEKINSDTNVEADGITAVKNVEKESNTNSEEKQLSEGELSSHESSEVEAYDVQLEVVCISDEEIPRKKKKKEKKSKKKKQDAIKIKEDSEGIVDKTKSETHESVELDDDDLYEILELSDDSSCYEVEGITLSKEPTEEEIVALSAKIDEIEKEEALVSQEFEKLADEKCNIEDSADGVQFTSISWKDRYLESKKVKKVLTTSNIFNVLRKKNKELKRKMEESKKREQEAEIERQKQLQKQQKEAIQEIAHEEGSIEQYNTLQGSTKYVDPVPDPVELAKKKEEELKEQALKESEALKEKEKVVEQVIEEQVTGEMKKDAKQLLKMYKMLLKHNDITKITDPKKKKTKKKKKKEKTSISVISNT